MISRDLANLFHVHAFNAPTTANDLMPFSACADNSLAGFTCSDQGTMSTAALGALGFAGRIIDRLGIRDNYNSVGLLVNAWAELHVSGTSCHIKYQGIAVGLQDSCTTCSADFANYSTANWPGRKALQIITNTTSTDSAYFACSGEAFALSTVQAGELTTGNTTSSGYAVSAFAVPVIPLTGAKRFLRMVVAPVNLATNSETGVGLHVIGSLLFGDADKGAASTAPRGRIWVTCACAT